MTRWRFALALLVSLSILTAGTLTSTAPFGSAQIDSSIQPPAGSATDQSILQKAPPGITPQRTPTQSTGDESIQSTVQPPSKQSSPWGQTELVVAIDQQTDRGRNTTALVADAIEYWNTAGKKHTKYPVKLTLRSEAMNPDIVVRFESHINCTTARWELGCAPVVTPGSTVKTPEVVRIDADYTTRTIQRVLKHEFGHILGIRHGESPEALMQPRYAATTR
ncbi:MAG: matrixin family metalloprotease, partial [Halobacteriaceae archaeon]